jgi:hypothetical protein
MIVKDKEETIARAIKLSEDLMNYVAKRCLESSSDNDDDPAEHIYMSVHAIACLCTRLSLTLAEYGKIYGIEKMTPKQIFAWISEIACEHITYNTKSTNNEH